MVPCDLFAVKGFSALGDIYERVRVLLQPLHCDALEGFFALWDNIYAYVFNTLDLSVVFGGQFITPQ
jgi:hypothetical protein